VLCVRGAVTFSMSKANGADDTLYKEKTVSFHKVAPVKKSRRPAPEPKKRERKRETKKRRPVGRDH
jgi:hypothetical protein